jgi:hypothetical protein
MRSSFCTLFDTNFSPQGIALIESILKFLPNARVFVLAMDDEVGSLLKRRFATQIEVLDLSQIESTALLEVKKDRSRGEYCWTLTPFLPRFILSHFHDVESVTYVDADLYFFRSPQIILDELSESGKTVLITEHGYDPQYDKSVESGRFCVQFMTFHRSRGALEILDWWSAKCLEWCFARHEDGKFGDQKYLDQWPELFGHHIHIYSQPWNTLAPWNTEWWHAKHSTLAESKPVFYHFHGLRIYKEGISCFLGYKIKSAASIAIYSGYLDNLLRVLDQYSDVFKSRFSSWYGQDGTGIKYRLKQALRLMKHTRTGRMLFIRRTA